MTPTAPNATSPSSQAVRILAGLHLVLWLALALCYALRPDTCAAVTLFPAWLWVLPGWLLVVPLRSHSRVASGCVLAWLGLLLLFAEEPRSLVRFRDVEPVRSAGGGMFRVVSLNCAGGSPDAAAEVAAWSPDLVLLQEVPAKLKVEALARRLYGANGSAITGYDTAVVARGPLAASLPARSHGFFVVARMGSQEGRALEIISLRLTPPIVRLDLWSPDCWREQIANRKVRRKQVEELAAYLAPIPPEVAVVVGGDFNAPAGDAIYRELQPRLRDSFAEAGAGWGNTGLNDLPVSRVDQVWISRPLRARAVAARRTRHSDHRMVVCDLSLAE